MSIVFRENWNTGKVEVLHDGTKVFQDSEYRVAAEWAKRQYSLSDHELMDIYQDYKEDIDSQ